ncbi:MAG: ParA family protein [Frankiaceae bacterium]
MIVTSVVSLKGGVGKTSLVLGLAGAAQASGMRVLVVDLDPQANASLVLSADRSDFTTNDVLADGRPGVLLDAVQPTAWGDEVDVVPSELALEHRNADGRDIEVALARSMEGLSGYDLVLIDSPPTLGHLAVTGMAAADRALIVAEPTLFSLVGAEKMLDAIAVVRRNFNRRLRPAGIVVNKARHTSEHEFRIQELINAYPDLVWQPVVPDRAATYQAQGAYVPVQRWRSAGAAELSEIYAQFLDRLMTAGPARRAGKEQ